MNEPRNSTWTSSVQPFLEIVAASCIRNVFRGQLSVSSLEQHREQLDDKKYYKSIPFQQIRLGEPGETRHVILNGYNQQLNRSTF